MGHIEVVSVIAPLCRISAEQTTVKTCNMQVSSAALRSRFAPHLLRKASEPSSRSRSNVLAAKRPGPVYASSSSSTLNKVLFTIPRTVQFGESLSVSGEGQELGSWNPNNSLPLKWNDGDLWAAEVPLPTGYSFLSTALMSSCLRSGHVKKPVSSILS